jgi:hypothetical protein
MNKNELQEWHDLFAAHAERLRRKIELLGELINKHK